MNNLDDLILKKVARLLLAVDHNLNSPKLRRELKLLLGLDHSSAIERLEQLSLRVKNTSWDYADRELDLADKSGIRVISFFDSAYPSELRGIADPPPFLYLKGRITKPKFAVAIVGARSASKQACHFAHSIAEEIVRHSGQVISGLALGVDAAAHRGSLCIGSSPGLAVLGSGLESIYPRQNQNLAEELIEGGGGLVSEYSICSHPQKWQFPERNRIISGLSDYVLIVEASLRSGSLITARLALEQGKDVGAVPGPINNSKCQGTNDLLANGAQLIRSFSDIIGSVPKINSSINSDSVVKEVSHKDLTLNYCNEEIEGVEKVMEFLEYHSRADFDFMEQKISLSALKLQNILAKMELFGDIVCVGEAYELA